MFIWTENKLSCDFYFDFSCLYEIYALHLQCKNNTKITPMKQILTYDDAMQLIEERSRQLENDPCVKQLMLNRFRDGESISNLKSFLVNLAIYTLSIPVDQR